MTRNIQYWMKILAYNCHPKTDDEKHPILDDFILKFYPPKTDDKKHPILDEIRRVQFHPNLDHKKHPILDENTSV